MKGKTRRFSLLSVLLLLALVGGVALPAFGQTVCCKQLQSVEEICNSSGCHEVITVQQCDSTVLGTGSNFQVHNYMCSLYAYPALYSPSGTCEVPHSPIAKSRTTPLQKADIRGPELCRAVRAVESSQDSLIRQLQGSKLRGVWITARPGKMEG